MIEEILKECPHCGKKFVPKSALQIYCNACNEDLKRKNFTKTCLLCGVQFDTHLSHKKYCSMECQEKAEVRKREKKRRELEREAKNIDRTCPVCGVQFVAHRSNKVYCSVHCKRRSYNTGNIEKDKKEKKKNQSVIHEKICPTCGI